MVIEDFLLARIPRLQKSRNASRAARQKENRDKQQHKPFRMTNDLK